MVTETLISICEFYHNYSKTYNVVKVCTHALLFSPLLRYGRRCYQKLHSSREKLRG